MGMKFKVVQWLKADVPVDYGYTLKDIQECARCCGVDQEMCRCALNQRAKVYLAMEDVSRRFQTELSNVNCHALLMRKQHHHQLAEMRFGLTELEFILRGYVRIGGRLDTSKRQRKAVMAKKRRFVSW